jgi:hypothetical protein
MQDEIFPDKEHFGRQFRNNAKMSSMGIIQMAAIMGSCVAGGAYLPIMSDEAMIVDKTGSSIFSRKFIFGKIGNRRNILIMKLWVVQLLIVKYQVLRTINAILMKHCLDSNQKVFSIK